jgi:hypothetical protein
MLRNRLFNLIVAISLVVVIALTIREAAATTGVITEGSSTKGEMMKCMGLPSRYSLRTEYVRDADMWIIRTEDGPTGVDGGFTNLLSDFRTCSR